MDLGLVGAPDTEIFDLAAADGGVVVTADSDFSMLLAARRRVGPSAILLRQVAELTWHVHSRLLLDNLPSVPPG